MVGGPRTTTPSVTRAVAASTTTRRARASARTARPVSTSLVGGRLPPATAAPATKGSTPPPRAPTTASGASGARAPSSPMVLVRRAPTVLPVSTAGTQGTTAGTAGVVGTPLASSTAAATAAHGASSRAPTVLLRVPSVLPGTGTGGAVGPSVIAATVEGMLRAPEPTVVRFAREARCQPDMVSPAAAFALLARLGVVGRGAPRAMGVVADTTRSTPTDAGAALMAASPAEPPTRALRAPLANSRTAIAMAARTAVATRGRATIRTGATIAAMAGNRTAPRAVARPARTASSPPAVRTAAVALAGGTPALDGEAVAGAEVENTPAATAASIARLGSTRAGVNARTATATTATVVAILVLLGPGVAIVPAASTSPTGVGPTVRTAPTVR